MARARSAPPSPGTSWFPDQLDLAQVPALARAQRDRREQEAQHDPLATARGLALGVGAEYLDVLPAGGVLRGGAVLDGESPLELVAVHDHVRVGELAELEQLRGS